MKILKKRGQWKRIEGNQKRENKEKYRDQVKEKRQNWGEIYKLFLKNGWMKIEAKTGNKK